MKVNQLKFNNKNMELLEKFRPDLHWRVYLGGVGLVGCCRLGVVLSDSLHVGSVISIRGHCRDLKHKQVQILNTSSEIQTHHSFSSCHLRRQTMQLQQETPKWRQNNKIRPQKLEPEKCFTAVIS